MPTMIFHNKLAQYITHAKIDQVDATLFIE